MPLDYIKGNDLVSVVAKTIRDTIPANELNNIYKDKPRQNFEYCSLYIDVLNLEQTKEMRNRGERTYFLDLRLHPPRDYSTAQSWCRDLAERILDTVATVQFKGTTLFARDSDLYYIEKEQVMHILVVYKFKTLRLPDPVPDPIYMETLKHEETLKYGKDD